MKKEVSPRTVVASVLALLAIITVTYYMKLLGRKPGAPPGGSMGGPSVPPQPPSGDPDLEVEGVIGYGAPEYRDDYAWCAGLDSPTGLAWSKEGALYIADTGNDCIRVVEARSGAGLGRVHTVVGKASGGQGGVPAGVALLRPMGLAIDSGGGLWIADTGHHALHRRAPDGIVKTMVGAMGQAGLADGPAGQARLNRPTGLAWDEQGRLYIADTGNRAIRRLLPDGRLETVVGGRGGGPLVAPTGLLWSSGQGLVVADSGAHRLFVVDAQGGVRPLPTLHAEEPNPEAVVAALLPDLSDPLLQGVAGVKARWAEPAQLGPPAVGDERLIAPVALAPTEVPGWVWVADAGCHCLYQVDVRTGELVLKVGIYMVPATPGWQLKGTGDGALLARPMGLARDPNGILYVSDCGNHRVVRVVPRMFSLPSEG